MGLILPVSLFLISTFLHGPTAVAIFAALSSFPYPSFITRTATAPHSVSAAAYGAMAASSSSERFTERFTERLDSASSWCREREAIHLITPSTDFLRLCRCRQQRVKMHPLAYIIPLQQCGRPDVSISTLAASVYQN